MVFFIVYTYSSFYPIAVTTAYKGEYTPLSVSRHVRIIQRFSLVCKIGRFGLLRNA